MCGQFASYPSLRDRVVLVTGGASGIGASIVEQFAEQGAKVSFLDIADGSSENPSFERCDLTDIAALRSAISRIESQQGPIRALVNNAANDDRHKLEDVTPEYWDRCMAVNLRHFFFAIQAVVPAMRSAGGGSIINLSSIAWIVPSTGMPGYVTAKAGIVGLTRTMAHELGPSNIRVNAVLPGWIMTERQQRLWLTPDAMRTTLDAQALKRLLTPADVARLVLFLAADDSSAITNQSYIVDGGWV
jgi:NAD(P)-dependent dehydrogenase (short-subunit alcohol dehydrogenase family)